MENKQTRKELLHTAICAAAGSTALIAGGFISRWNHFIPAFIITLLAIASYFYIVFAASHHNWLDLRALFAGVWLGTVGLAAFRLAEYQEPWQLKTWVLFGLAYGLFMMGMTVGIITGNRVLPGFLQKIKNRKLGRVRFSHHPNRLFAICIITTGIGIACFIANILIRGYIPSFSDDPLAYATFYTKFHLFAIAASSISGLCYYCLTTQKLSYGKKALLWLCILYSTFLFPILIVSRAIFATSALSLATVVFYRHGKKLWVLVLCVALMLGVYLGISSLRGYTDDQLMAYFQPATITLDPQKQPTKEPDSSEATSPTDNDVSEPDTPIAFSLSPKMAFLYTYLTVGHDNFNEVVQNLDAYTYGARQLQPFNVILRIDALDELATSTQWYSVEDYLPTVSLFGDAYYDFHTVGVLVFAIFWSFVVGLIQSLYTSTGNPFALLILGNTMTPVAMSFFECWMSYFPHWMLWGTVLIFLFAATVSLDPKKRGTQ